MTLGQAIKTRFSDLCQEQNMTISELGTISKVVPSIIDDITAGTAEHIPYQAIVQLCQGLKIQLPDFFQSDLFRGLEHS